MRTDITLFLPQECGTGAEKKATIGYKGVSGFRNNGNGTVTFKTQSFGKITTSLHWRLAEELPDDAPLSGTKKSPRSGNHNSDY